MSNDLYATLGVSRKARKATIVKAFRRLAMKHHPDRGGDRAEFEKIEAAYSILGDDAKRKRYDETGEVDGPAQNILADVMQVLGPCYQDVLKSIIESGRSPEHTDVCKMMRDAIGNKISEINREMAKPKRVLASYQKLLGRWSAKDQPNLMDGLTRQMADALRDQIKQMQAFADRNKQALEFLKAFSFKFDPQEMPRSMNGFVRLGQWTTV